MLAIASIAIARPALADDEAPAPSADASAPTDASAPADSTAATEGPPPSTMLAAVPEASDSGAPATTLTETSASAPEEPAARFPRSVIARPLTLPAGLAMLGADASANHDFSAMGGSPIIGYGFTDDFEVQIPYSFAAKDFEARGSVAVDAGYKLLRGAAGGKLEVIARVRGGYDTLAEAATPLMLGVHAQYNFTDTLAVLSGYAGTQQISIALADDDTMAKPIDFGLPIAIGYQPTPELYLQVDTKLASFGLKDSSNAFIGADTTPVSLTAVYNVINALDVQAAIGTDLTNSPGDSLSFLVGARYYAGKL